MNQSKILSLIGLATRSRNLVSGEFATEKAVKEGKAALVILASDASDNTKKKFQNSCTFYNVRMEIFADKVQLGHAMGKEIRASLAITDKGFAASIEKQLDQK